MFCYVIKGVMNKVYYYYFIIITIIVINIVHVPMFNVNLHDVMVAINF